MVRVCDIDIIRAEVRRIRSDREIAPELQAESLQHLRRISPETSRMVDQVLLEDHEQVQQGLREARDTIDQFKALMEKLKRPALVPAVYLRSVDGGEAPQAWVAIGNSQRIVNVLDDVDLEWLETGDEVFLSNDGSTIIIESPLGMPRCGEIATFEERLDDGRLMLRERDTTYIVEQVPSLQSIELRAGDCLRWDRSLQLAFEVVQRSEGKRFLMEDVPDIPLSQIGGQERALGMMLSALTTSLVAPETARRYAVDSKNTILMHGPAGCGKTLLARIAAAELRRLSKQQVRFGVVKPGEFESPWVGETQQTMRACFDALRDAARDGFAVLFMDEIESIGRIRGHMAGYHSDRFLAALLAELDGFADRGRVAIISATNRKELLDPALLSRISDVEIAVGRPTKRGAAEIFAIHLPAEMPYCPNGACASDTRQQVIEAALSRIYGPNTGNEICELRFRDGKTRVVTAAELISGRAIEQVCREARRNACERDIRTGDAGIRIADMDDAVAQLLGRLMTLTPQNVGNYLDDLPQDVDVVAVTPIHRTVQRPYSYLRVA